MGYVNLCATCRMSIPKMSSPIKSILKMFTEEIILLYDELL